ncbi:MAG: hypothetical protein JAZ18_04305 [Candidatus Thiodiazotropha endolucinida]|nr:hypothetical protein [Candidatus Thiodiazotropha endolucinida]
MEIEEINEFIVELKNIEKFLAELAARDFELRSAGVGSSRHWESYQNAESSFVDFDKKLYDFVRFTKFIDTELHERIKNIESSAGLADGIAQISVSIRVAAIRRNIAVAIHRTANSFYDALLVAVNQVLKTGIKPNRGLYFSNQTSLSEVLVGFNRLIPLAEDALIRYQLKKSQDSESFKPSNINIDSVNIYISNSINVISSSGEIGPETKEKLIEYLDDIRAELAKDTPKWRKVVGGLVIVSTILGGLAVAPQAIENVQKAVTEILGTSIEKEYPKHAPSGDGSIKLIMT